MEPLKHCLGNLTFLTETDNQINDNSTFEVKKEIFRVSRINMNLDIANYTSWNKTNIEARKDKLINMGLSIFDLSKY